ncbi:hypothetical protein MHYP_G00250870 [Metynnis hypsauchen]
MFAIRCRPEEDGFPFFVLVPLKVSSSFREFFLATVATGDAHGGSDPDFLFFFSFCNTNCFVTCCKKCYINTFCGHTLFGWSPIDALQMMGMFS